MNKLEEQNKFTREMAVLCFITKTLKFILNNYDKITKDFMWDYLNDEYEKLNISTNEFLKKLNTKIEETIK